MNDYYIIDFINFFNWLSKRFKDLKIYKSFNVQNSIIPIFRIIIRISCWGTIKESTIRKIRLVFLIKDRASALLSA